MRPDHRLAVVASGARSGSAFDRPRALVAAALAFGALTFASTSASAFCRTYSCDPAKTSCAADPRDPTCTAGGKPLFWPVSCVSFSLQQDASSAQGIDFATFQQVADRAFTTWQDVDCGGGKTPSLKFSDFGAASCDKHEYNQGTVDDAGKVVQPAQGNANLLVFRDKVWPYEGTANTLALTTLTFNVESGEIYDADMEINAVKGEVTISTSDTNVAVDLLSVLTHEAGHFIGIAHSSSPTATMFATYTPGTLDLRSLEQDDVNAVCSIYPPDRSGLPTCDATPRHGYLTECASPLETVDGCGCRVPGGPAGSESSPRSALAFSALALFAAAFRFRRRS
jgi:hypothetical protein